MTAPRTRLAWLPLFLAIAAVIGAGAWNLSPMGELFRELSGHGSAAQWLRGAGSLIALFSGGFVAARALGARSHLSIAAAGACLPWLFGVVATKSAFEVEIPWLPPVASASQAVFVADLLSEALPWSVLGAAATSGLALGASFTSAVDRGRDARLEVVLPLLVAVAAGVRVAHDGTLLGMAAATTRRGLGEGGDPELRGIAPLFGTEPIAEQLDPLLSAFSGLATAHVLASSVLALAALAVAIASARGATGGRERLAALGVSLLVGAMGFLDIGLDRALCRSAALRARPAWTAVEGLRVPASGDGDPDNVPFAGWSMGERFMDEDGVEHPLSAEALAPLLAEAADEGERRDAAERAWYLASEPTPSASAGEATRPPDALRSESPRRAALAIDRAATAQAWRVILAAAHQARLTTLCIAVEETLDGEAPSAPRSTGIAWVDALARHPASLRCFRTADALDEAYDDELLLHVRLRGRPFHALSARPRTEAATPPVFCPVAGDGTLDLGPPRPPLYLLVEDAMRTDELVTIEEDEDLSTLVPVLAESLPNHSETPGPLPDAPPYRLRAGDSSFGVVVAMAILHASPPEIAGDEAIEIFMTLDTLLDAPLVAEVEAHLRASSDALASCYVAERREEPRRGGLVQLNLVTDAHGVPFDVGCTGSGRSSPALCECFDAALTAAPADPETARTEAGSLRRARVALWLQARGADLIPAAP